MADLDFNRSPNPVCRLKNFETFCIYHLPHLQVIQCERSLRVTPRGCGSPHDGRLALQGGKLQGGKLDSLPAKTSKLCAVAYAGFL